VSAPWRGREYASLAALVAVLALLPYLNSLTAGFALDDLPRIVENPMVQGKEPAVRLLTWVDRPEIYRPPCSPSRRTGVWGSRRAGAGESCVGGMVG
jgi:hypothetical protein